MKSLLYVIGDPGVGKTTLVRGLTDGLPRKQVGRPVSHIVYGCEPTVVELGRRKSAFVSGTSAMPHWIQPRVEAWMSDNDHELVLAEGGRLGFPKFFEEVLRQGWEVQIVYLAAAADVTAARRTKRIDDSGEGGTLGATWLKGEMKRVATIAKQWPDLVVEIDASQPADAVLEQVRALDHPVVKALRNRAESAAAAAAGLRLEMLPVVEIPIGELHEAAWNANRCTKATLRKIRASIEEYGFVENLVARRLADGTLEVLSGNHRLQLLRDLGVELVPTVIVDVDDAHARLLAQTLNRTRGRDDPLAYRALLADVLEALPADDIVQLLPEDRSSLDGILGILPAGEPEVELPPPLWAVIVECKDQGEQDDLLDRFTGEGRQVRTIVRGGNA